MTPQAFEHRGGFITFEGGEGGGKSTQVKALAARLATAGIPCIATREPGGSEVAERIREGLLDGRFEALGCAAEALLFAAARIDHLDTRIKPALAVGTWVVSDRFHDSTRAYQGALGRLDKSFLDGLERVTLAGVRPDLTIILDVPAEVGLARAAHRRNSGAAVDRFEKQDLSFHRALRQAFLAIAGSERARCAVIDATRNPAIVEQEIWDLITHRFDLHHRFGNDTGKIGKYT